MSFVWGDEPQRSETGGIPFKLYEPRRRRVPELLEDGRRWGERIHLVQGDRRLTFDHAHAAIEQVAHFLLERGVGPGDRVLLLAANSPEWVIAFWAIARLDAVVAPGNGWWSEAEVQHAIDLVEPTVVIADTKRLERVPASATTIDVAELRPIVDAAEDAPARELPPVNQDGDENDPALIVFSAGTTGLPKGVTLAHRSWIAQMHQTLAVSRRLPHTLADDDPGFASMLTGPLFHIGGIHATGLAMLGAGKLCFLEGRFDPGQVLELIEREKVEVWGAIPTMTLRVLDHPDIKTRDVSSMRSIPLGGAPVSPELMDRLQAAFPNTEQRITQVYGMAETSGTVARASGKLLRTHRGTTGHPLPLVDLEIADPDAEMGEGEILVRCPTQMLGYWKQDSSEIIGENGFVHTGDLGRIDDEGHLYITGRAKDVIIRGGENIAAPHVEAALLSHPDVADAAVVGLPHADLGEEVAAAVLPRAGASLDHEILAAHVGTRIAHFAVPSRWWISDEPLPMTDAGKADKKLLRQIFPAHSER
jgi:long-chain acyl-CoA synthetase